MKKKKNGKVITLTGNTVSVYTLAGALLGEQMFSDYLKALVVFNSL